jgi:hypothetical protein
MKKNFWEQCVKAGCVVIPIKTYSKYADGYSLNDEQFVGIKFAALHFNNEAVGPEYCFMIDESQKGEHKLYDTPHEALMAFIIK